MQQPNNQKAKLLGPQAVQYQQGQQQYYSAQPATVAQGQAGGNYGPGVAVLAVAPPPKELIPADTAPGLEYLIELDHIWVMDKPQLIEQVTDWEANQKWQCLNNSGLQVYWAQENTECCTRQCFGSYRPFTINCFDPAGRPVLVLTRPYRWNSAWHPLFGLPLNFCCLQDMKVQDLNNNIVGHVQQRWSIWKPWYDLVDETGALLLSIEGPCCTIACFGDVEFKLLGPAQSVGGQQAQIGSVTKKWGGLLREAFLNNADNFQCQFPKELTTKAKALVFAATFLIDFMFFEDRNKKNRQQSRIDINL